MSNKILYFSSDNNPSSGAFLSMVKLVSLLTKNSNLDILIVLPENGDGIKLLEREGLDYIVVRSEDWIMDGPKTFMSVLKKIKKSLKNIIAIYRLIKHVKKERYDLIYLNTIYTYIGALVSLVMGIPYIWHIKEIKSECKLWWWLINKASKIITVSKNVAKSYIKLDSSKIEVVYEGIDNYNFYKPNRKILEDNFIKMICVSAIYKEKGQWDLLEALNILVKKGIDNWLLKFIGAGDIDVLNYKVKEYGLENNIEVLGYKSNVEDYMGWADVSFMPTHKEAFGRVIVESMLCGCLTVASNVGGIPEIITNKATGLLHVPQDPVSIFSVIEYLINNRERCQQIAKCGQEDVLLKFTANKNAEEILKICEIALGGGRI